MTRTTQPTTSATNREPAATWAIHDPVIRLRVYGSERVFDLATSDRWVLGSSPECSLRLDDPSGRVSRRHADLSRESGSWTIADLGSTNGLCVNRELRRSFQLAPGDEIELGGITLLAESERSMELHDLLQRWLGWSTSRLVEVDRALSAVREMANLRATLVLRGAESLVGVARRLHRIVLGDRPFVSLGRNERGVEGLDRAANGVLCFDARRLPPDIQAVIANLNLRALDIRVRLVACADSAESAADLATWFSRIVTISIPPITERGDEFERLLEAYAWDAVEELGASSPRFQPGDPELIRASGAATLDEIEDAARRLVALRNWGVSGGAKRLRLTHSALSRWARRRNIPTFPQRS
jgi:pSer/pThr/pTyr-binding forkhead associated (FHA) protein